MREYVEETLYLYKILDYIYYNYEIVNNKYKNIYYKKILTLSNDKLTEIINLLVEWEEKINNSLNKHYLNQKINENKFMEKFLLYNK